MRSRIQFVVLGGLLVLLGAILVSRQLPHKRSERERLVWQKETYRREGFGRGVRRLLNLHRYDELEAMADTLRVGAYTYESGYPQIATFFEDTFGDVDDNDDAELWDRHMSRLSEWVDSRPASATARIAMAEGLIGRGWAARGTGYSSTVSRKAWRTFDDDINAAANVLRQSPDSVRALPEWWHCYLVVLNAQHNRDSLYLATYREAVTRFPSYWPFHIHMAYHLMPRWHGEPGDWEAFAMACAKALPDSMGPEVYARIILSQAKLVQNVFVESNGVSWEMLTRGLDAWEKRCPESIVPRSARALLAWESSRRDVARQAFAAVGDTVELDVWWNYDRFLKARRWAQKSG